MGLESLHQGSHVCSIYQNKQQQFRMVFEFLMEGLNLYEKVVYVADDNSPEEVISEFKKAGHDIDRFLKSKQLEVLTKKETYLKDGEFTPEKMIAFVEEAEKKALKDGYSGFRATGEMTWIIDSSVNTNILIEYESKLNNFFDNSKSKIICQYNEKKINNEILSSAIRTHPTSMIYGKIYENKYFYTEPRFMRGGLSVLPENSYQTLIDIIVEE